LIVISGARLQVLQPLQEHVLAALQGRVSDGACPDRWGGLVTLVQTRNRWGVLASWQNLATVVGSLPEGVRGNQASITNLKLLTGPSPGLSQIHGMSPLWWPVMPPSPASSTEMTWFWKRVELLWSWGGCG